MDELLDILSYSTGSLFWGFLIGAVCLALFFFIIKGWFKNAFFTTASYVVGAILGLILIVESTMICGALAIKSSGDEYQAILTEDVGMMYDYPGSMVSSEDSDVLCKQLIAVNPLLAHYIGGADFQGFTAAQLPQAMIDELHSFMNWYILRRVLWSLGFVLVGAFVVIKTMSRKSPSSCQKPQKKKGKTTYTVPDDLY